MFYLSAYLERHRDMYYNRLFGITDDGQWDDWVLFFLTAIKDQARENCAKAKAILNLYDRMKLRLPEIVPTQFTVQAIDALFDNPIFRTTDFIQRTGISKRTAMRVLGALEESGTLSTIRESRGRTAAVLAFAELISITEGKEVV